MEPEVPSTCYRPPLRLLSFAFECENNLLPHVTSFLLLSLARTLWLSLLFKFSHTGCLYSVCLVLWQQQHRTIQTPVYACSFLEAAMAAEQEEKKNPFHLVGVYTEPGSVTTTLLLTESHIQSSFVQWRDLETLTMQGDSWWGRGPWSPHCVHLPTHTARTPVRCSEGRKLRKQKLRSIRRHCFQGQQ